MADVHVNTESRVAAWRRALSNVKHKSDALHKAKNELSEAEAILGGFLTPDNAVAGESFCIWVHWEKRDRLVEITKLNDDDWDIEWRGSRAPTNVR